MTYGAVADLDRIDRRILEVLQANGRLTVAELATQVSLSPSPCWRRVQLLEQAGFILGYGARLDRRRLGLGVHAFVSLRMESHTPEAAIEFESKVLMIPEVVSCQNLSGQYDYQLELVSRDNDSFAKLVREVIRELPGVRDLHTSFILKELKAFVALPVPP